MSTKFLSPGWRMPRNANQSKSTNYSLDFDGNDAIEIPQTTATDITGSNTIAMWVNRSTSGSNQNLVNKRGTSGTQYAFFIETTNLLGFDDGTGAKAYGNTVIPTDVWTHVAVVVESSGCTFYINGVSDGGVSSGISVGANTHTTYIGKKYSNTFYLNGKLSQVCFFDYALSASQVTTLWGGGTSASNPMALPNPPIAYYPLGGSAGAFQTPVNNNDKWLIENNAIGDYVFDFPIAEQSVNISNNFENYTEMSLSTWVNFNNFSGYQYVFSTAAPNNGAGTQFTIAANPSSGVIYSYDGANLNSTGVSVALNTWNHILVTQTGTTRKVFINGQQAGSDITTSALNLNQGTAFIGKYHTAGYSANAKISNVQIFNTALSATEVTTLYNYGSPIRTLANIPQSSNLKAWYKLDASEIYNSSSTEWSVDNNANTSTYDTSINLVRASSQKIDIANGSELDFTGDFTMSIWVNLTTSSNNMGVFNKTSQANTNGVSLFKRGGANFEFYVSEFSNVLTFASQGDNIWQQITITLNRTTGERIAYVNGEQAATLTHIKTFTFPNQGWDIGTFANNSPNYLDAKVSNFKLFNSVLSPTEVQTLYNNGTPLTDMSSFTSLQGWWKLNNLSSGLTDSSSNSNNATATSTTTEYPGFVNALAGDSLGMSQTNLVQSDLQTVAPYSKYAMSFDGINDYITTAALSNFITNNISVSAWVNFTTLPSGFNGSFLGPDNSFNEGVTFCSKNGVIRFAVEGSINSTPHFVENTVTLVADQWYHFCGTWDGSTIELFTNGVSQGTFSYSGSITTTRVLQIGQVYNTGYNIHGKLSNIAIWNTGLSSAEVREIYNQGLPSNLHNFSGTAPVAWWQLGENSSFVSDWICADEISSNNGESNGMGVGALTNGVGTTANGTSTGMAVGALVGDAPYSTANAISSGMAVTAKGTNVP